MADKKISELDSVSIFSDNDNFLPVAQTDATKKTTILTFANYVLGKLGSTLWALTTKTTPVGADTITINDTEDGNNLKKVSLLNLWTNYLKAKADLLYQAILTDVNFGSFSNSLTSKTTPVGADSINIADSADSNKAKKLSLTNLVSFLGNYFATTSNVLKVRWRARGDGSIDVLGSTLPNTTGTHTGLTSSGNANYDALLNRSRYKSASTAGSSCGFRDGSYRYYNFTKGFKISFIFVISDDTYVTGSRLFCGLYESGSVIGNVEPSTLVSIISIGKDSTDTNLQVIHNNGGASTKVDLGSNFPANTTFADMYKVTFEANASGTSVNYTVKRFGTAFTATGTISTNINTSGNFAPHLWRNNGATASPVALTLYDLEADIKLD